MIFMRGQRVTGKILRNNYHHGSCGPSLTGETSSANFNTVLVFEYSKCLSIFIKKHSFRGCIANWSQFWIAAM